MKKTLFVGALVVLLVALSFSIACTPEADDVPSTPTDVSPTSDTTEAPAEAEDVITLRFASSAPEIMTQSRYQIHFMDYVEEKSEGRVKFDRFWGGVLGTDPEMLSLLSSGSIDFGAAMPSMFRENLPYHNYFLGQLDSTENAFDYVNQLVFEIPETSALMEEEDRENNLKSFNYFAMGQTGILTKEPISSMSDLEGKKLGSMTSQPGLATMGLDVVEVMMPDMYESLSRGICEATSIPLEPILQMKLYEVCKNYYYNKLYGAANQISMNLDTWNSLPADVQDLFWEASKVAEAYSISEDAAMTVEYEEILRANGVTISTLPDADCEAWFKVDYFNTSEEMLSICEKLGKTEGMKTVLKYADQITWGESEYEQEG